MSQAVRSRVCLFLACVALGTTSHAFAVSVTDDSGHRITLDTPAKRIVTLAPNLTELIGDLGATDLLVGVSAFSDVPSAAIHLPQVGSSRGVDIERIATLKPDLVLAWTSGSPAGQLESIERLGIVVFRSEPHTLEDVATTLTRLGTLTGHDAQGRALAVQFRARVEALTTRYSTRPPVRVFYQVWDSPLMTVGGEQLISKIIAMCGGRNVFASLTALAPVVDREAAILADPEVIVAASGEGSTAATAAQWREWKNVAAVRTNSFVILDPAIITRQTPRLLDGAQTICEALEATRTRRTAP